MNTYLIIYLLLLTFVVAKQTVDIWKLRQNSCQVTAESLTLSFSILSLDKSKTMAFDPTTQQLPIGASVVVTLKGAGKDANGNAVDAPITNPQVSVGDNTILSIAPVAGQSNQWTVTALANGNTVLVGSAADANGVALAPISADITAGTGTPPPPPVATSLAFVFGDIVPAPASAAK